MNALTATTVNINSIKVDGDSLPDAAFNVLGFTAQDHEFKDYVPTPDPDFVFSREFFREYRSFHNNPGEMGFFIVGPTGCGKTTAISNFCGHANIPLMKLDCNEDIDQIDLKGSLIPRLENGQMSTHYNYGALTFAYKYGFTVLADEMNRFRPSVSAALGEIIRSKTLVIESTGEIIHRHPNFRFVATANGFGRGLDDPRFSGSNDLNAALLNRLWLFKSGYPDLDTEVDIICSKTRMADGTSFPRDIAVGMTKVANMLRPQISGVGANGSLDFDFSTRTLLSWADKVRRFFSPNCENILQYGLQVALLRMLEQEEVSVVERACLDVFGDEYSKSVSS